MTALSFFADFRGLDFFLAFFADFLAKTARPR